MEVLSKLLDSDHGLSINEEKIVIQSFMQRYDVNYEDAADIFEETKKWLWLAAKGEELDFPLFMDRPITILDEMWHTFILHTKQYMKFCMSNFKQFIHHIPTPAIEKEPSINDLDKNPLDTIEKHEERVRKQYSVIYDHLGPETLLKWYSTIAEKYTLEHIKSLKKI